MKIFNKVESQMKGFGLMGHGMAHTYDDDDEIEYYKIKNRDLLWCPCLAMSSSLSSFA